jgi:hypothetical protein
MEENMRKKQADEDIIALQRELVPLVAELYANKEICFTSVPAVGAPGGYYWEPVEKISGKFIFENFEADPEGVVKASKQIADDYQKVIAKYLEKNPERYGNILEDGKKWVFGKLLTWSGPIVEEGLITHQEIFELANAFEDVIGKRGEEFFDYFHGNVIGDHIFVGSDKTLFLLGMRITPKPGKGYYDFLRILDWLTLKSDNAITDFDRVISWIKKYLGEYDWEEVKLVFALRCIGILGWDMLHRGDFGKGDSEKKKETLLKFIKREY